MIININRTLLYVLDLYKYLLNIELKKQLLIQPSSVFTPYFEKPCDKDLNTKPCYLEWEFKTKKIVATPHRASHLSSPNGHSKSQPCLSFVLRLKKWGKVINLEYSNFKMVGNLLSLNFFILGVPLLFIVDPFPNQKINL